MTRCRLQLDFSEEALRFLDDLKAQTNCASRTELIKDAIRLFSWILERCQAGEKIVVVKEKDGTRKEREVEFLFLKKG